MKDTKQIDFMTKLMQIPTDRKKKPERTDKDYSSFGFEWKMKRGNIFFSAK